MSLGTGERMAAASPRRRAAPPPDIAGAREGGNQSVDRALTILDLVASRGELGVRDLARDLRLAPSIAHRLVTSLAARGYLEQLPANARYRIGHQAFRVGSAFLEHGDIGSLAAGELARLAEEHHVNGFLGVLRGREVVYLASVQSPTALVITHPPGAVTHPHTTALGKVLLSALTDAEVERLMGPPPYQRRTPRSLVTPGPLIADLRRIRAGGEALSDGENYEQVYAVGAALRDAAGRTVAAISGALPRHGLSVRDRANLRDLIRGAAERISRRLGAPPS